MWHLGLGISDKKIIPRKTELTKQMVISDGIPAVPRNRISRNSDPNPSAEEKTSRNSVPRNRNRSKLSEFPSKPFSGRENNSEFCPEPFRRRENNSEQNAAAAVSDSTQSESSCRDRKNWFPPPWLKDIFFKIICLLSKVFASLRYRRKHHYRSFRSLSFR